MLFNFLAKSYRAGMLQESGITVNSFNPLIRLTVQPIPKNTSLQSLFHVAVCGAAVEGAAGFCVWRSQIRIIKGLLGGGGAESRPLPGL